MGKVVVVTGGSRGIGAACAVRAAKGGWDVAVNYAADEAAARTVVDAVAAEGRRAVAIQGHMGRDAEIAALFDKAEAELGPVTGLVNNAGITGTIAKLADADPQHIRETIDVNLTGAIMVARAAVLRMSTARGGRGGRIVNITSVAATLGSANTYVWYAASKAGLDAFTLGLAQEVVGEGIYVNAVAPGLTDTGLHAHSGTPDRAQQMAPSVPIGRAAAPGEIAEAVAWLLSDAASYCVGSILRVGGGR